MELQHKISNINKKKEFNYELMLNLDNQIRFVLSNFLIEFQDVDNGFELLCDQIHQSQEKSRLKQLMQNIMISNEFENKDFVEWPSDQFLLENVSFRDLGKLRIQEIYWNIEGKRIQSLQFKMNNGMKTCVFGKQQAFGLIFKNTFVFEKNQEIKKIVLYGGAETGHFGIEFMDQNDT